MPAPQESLDRLRERRFGLFIHWGLYALPARHEWVKKREGLTDEQYQPYFDHFDPDLYDPAVWAKAAAGAGMKYSVLTSKHHEGFCLWDSDLTDYKATNTPAGRDLLRPYVDAFRAEGLGVGFYHSLIDWHHPSYTVDTMHPRIDDAEFRAREAGRDFETYRKYLFGQVDELLTRYGDLDVIWFDFSYPGREAYGLPGKGREDWHSEELMEMVRRRQPQILINNRLDIPGDFVTPEQVQPHVPPTIDGREVPWEACQTLNGSWGYDRDNLDWKSPDLLVRMLVDSVSKDGNLLLNVGPTGRGEFDERALATLEEIGRWTRRNGRSVYGAGPATGFEAPPDTRYTRRGDRLYVHLFTWPFRHLHLPGLAGRVKYAQLLHDASEVRWQEYAGVQTDSNVGVRGIPEGTVTLELPVQRPDQLVPVVELFLS